MKILLTLIMGLGGVLLSEPFAVPVAAAQMPEAPEAGEVKIISPTLPPVGDIIGRFTDPAIREVEVRGLQQGPSTEILIQIGGQLRPGQEVDFRTVDGQRFRVENENGQLRVRLSDVAVSAAAAKDVADALKARFGRVEIQGVDQAGNRVRLEIREGVVKKDEVAGSGGGRGRTGTSASINDERARDRGRDLDHSIRGRERAELERERVERPEKPEVEKSERVERPERSGRH